MSLCHLIYVLYLLLVPAACKRVSIISKSAYYNLTGKETTVVLLNAFR